MTDKERESFEEWAEAYTASPEYQTYDAMMPLWDAWKAATKRAKERERELVRLLKDCQQHVDEVALTVAGACSHARNMGLKSEATHQKDLRSLRELQTKIKQLLKRYESEAE